MGATDLLVVADAGPLIHLDELDATDLLTGFSRVLVPDAVWQEVLAHRPGVKNWHIPTIEHVGPLPAGPDLQAIGKIYTLHRGEWEALTTCAHHPGARLLTDDTAARLAARALGFAASGTIGVLVRAGRIGQRSRADVISLLEAVSVRTSLHIRPALLSQIIEEVRSS